jgi:MerR family transcriptional regulator, copper efflux regulator
MNKHVTIGQVAQEVGIPPKTIRYYEEINLIQPAKRMDNRYRAYTKEDIARLRLIKQARILGLSLAEVKHLVEECFEGSYEHLKERFLTKLPQYITAVKGKIDELQELQAQLESLQDTLTILPLTDPQKRVGEKACCEILAQMETITQKGGVRNGREQTQS